MNLNQSREDSESSLVCALVFLLLFFCAVKLTKHLKYLLLQRHLYLEILIMN